MIGSSLTSWPTINEFWLGCDDVLGLTCNKKKVFLYENKYLLVLVFKEYYCLIFNVIKL